MKMIIRNYRYLFGSNITMKEKVNYSTSVYRNREDVNLRYIEFSIYVTYGRCKTEINFRCDESNFDDLKILCDSIVNDIKEDVTVWGSCSHDAFCKIRLENGDVIVSSDPGHGCYTYNTFSSSLFVDFAKEVLENLNDC